MSPGVNVGRVGPTFDPSDIAASGAKGIRCTYHVDTPIGEGRAWLGQIRARGLSVLMCLDNDSNFWGAPHPWRDGLARVRNTYGDLVDMFQVLNEPDGGWYPDTTETIEERAAAHPSSWVMEPDDVSRHLQDAREVLGQNAVIIGPGLASGHPEWATTVNWTPVDYLACHPYAKSAGSPSLMALIAAYSAFGWPLAVTEYDAAEPGMHTWMSKNIMHSWAFCWSNVQHPGHGLIERPEALAEFKAANQITEPEEPIMALPIPVYKTMWQAHLPSAEFHETFGIEKFWMENYKELGAVTSLAEYRQGKNAYRTFVGGVIHWVDGVGAKIA